MLVNVFLLLPGLTSAGLLAAWQPSGALALVLTFTGWTWNPRLFRAQALALWRKEYILAARAMGSRSSGPPRGGSTMRSDESRESAS